MVAILVVGAYVALFYAFTATTYLASPHSPDLRKLTLSAMNDVAERSRYFEQKFYQFAGWGRPETQSPVENKPDLHPPPVPVSLTERRAASPRPLALVSLADHCAASWVDPNDPTLFNLTSFRVEIESEQAMCPISAEQGFPHILNPYLPKSTSQHSRLGTGAVAVAVTGLVLSLVGMVLWRFRCKKQSVGESRRDTVEPVEPLTFGSPPSFLGWPLMAPDNVVWSETPGDYNVKFSSPSLLDFQLQRPQSEVVVMGTGSMEPVTQPASTPASVSGEASSMNSPKEQQAPLVVPQTPVPFISDNNGSASTSQRSACSPQKPAQTSRAHSDDQTQQTDLLAPVDQAIDAKPSPDMSTNSAYVSLPSTSTRLGVDSPPHSVDVGTSSTALSAQPIALDFDYSRNDEVRAPGIHMHIVVEVPPAIHVHDGTQPVENAGLTVSMEFRTTNHPSSGDASVMAAVQPPTSTFVTAAIHPPASTFVSDSVLGLANQLSLRAAQTESALEAVESAPVVGESESRCERSAQLAEFEGPSVGYMFDTTTLAASTGLCISSVLPADAAAPAPASAILPSLSTAAVAHGLRSDEVREQTNVLSGGDEEAFSDEPVQLGDCEDIPATSSRECPTVSSKLDEYTEDESVLPADAAAPATASTILPSLSTAVVAHGLRSDDVREQTNVLSGGEEEAFSDEPAQLGACEDIPAMSSRECPTVSSKLDENTEDEPYQQRPVHELKIHFETCDGTNDRHTRNRTESAGAALIKTPQLDEDTLSGTSDMPQPGPVIVQGTVSKLRNRYDMGSPGSSPAL